MEEKEMQIMRERNERMIIEEQLYKLSEKIKNDENSKR